MADRLEADSEARREQFDVVAAVLRRPVERRVRHQQRPREVVREPDAGQVRCVSRPQLTCVVRQMTEERSMLEERELSGELERPLPVTEPR